MDSIGRFRIESRIGQGSMGVVYLATDTRLGRRVALKTFDLPEGLSERRQNEFRERFLREARAAGALSHRGIVTVYDAGEDEASDVPFIAMEYVQGMSLQERIAREGTVSPEDAVPIVTALADALHAAHAHGIVHRDIKPANVLVREDDGAVKVADFGVARVDASTLTTAGVPIGSPAYMSPEQIRGGDIDGRSDLFSLAVLTYELLTGRRPFQGEHAAEVVYAVSHEHPIPASRARPGLPESLDRFFDVALAKGRDARFEDGRALARAFEEAVHRPTTSPIDATIRLEPAGGDAGVPAGPAGTDPGDAGGRGAGFAGRLRSWRAALTSTIVLVAVLGGWLVFGHRPTYLKIDARSGVTRGELTVYVDGEPVYTRALAAPDDRQGFLKRVARQNMESFETLVRVDPGTREVTAHVEAPDGGDDVRTAIVVDFERGETRTIELSAGRMFGSALSLKSR